MTQSDGSLSLTADVFCPKCGYNLRGGVGGRCPECGRDYVPGELSASRIPWSNRKHLGRAKAWVMTVLVASFRTSLVAESLQAELPRRDARWFWLTCIIPLWAGLTALLLGAGLDRGSFALLAMFNRGPSFMGWPLQVIYPWHLAAGMPWVLAGVAAAVVGSLALLPMRIAASCRYPADLGPRAITAAHYLAGALVGGAGVGCAMALLLASPAIATGRVRDNARLIVVSLSVCAPVMALLLWTFAAYRFHRRTTIASGTSAPPFGLVFPLLLFVNLAVWLILVPWVVGLLWLIVSTLRN